VVGCCRAGVAEAVKHPGKTGTAVGGGRWEVTGELIGYCSGVGVGDIVAPETGHVVLPVC
jgi:hypothetical protein